MIYSKEKDECPVCGKPKPISANYCSVECSGLSRRKADRPSKEQLEKDIDEFPLIQLAKKYGVSDNTIRVWAFRYGLKTNSKRESRRLSLKNKAVDTAKTKGIEMIKAGTVMKQKKEVTFTPEQQDLIDLLKSPKARNAGGRFDLSNKTKQQFSNLIDFLKENNYRDKDIAELIDVSIATVVSYRHNKRIKKAKTSKTIHTSPEVSLQKHSVRMIEPFVSKTETSKHRYMIDEENNSVSFSSMSDLLDFLYNRKA
jgi:transposase